MGSRVIDLGTPHLVLERRGVLAWCTIDRPEARNALSPAMYRGIGRALELVTASDELEALVLTGTGDVFVPGGDMGDPTQAEPWPGQVLPFGALRHSRVPVVTAVNGICQASGLLLALLSDVAVASDRAVFRAPELLRGFPDMWFAAVLPAHIGVGRARDLMLTGRRVDAREACVIGLVERVVAHDELEQAAEEAAYELLEAAPLARNAWRRAVNASYGVVDESSQEAAASSPEVEEGFGAFLAKRPPAWSRRPTTQPLATGDHGE